MSNALTPALVLALALAGCQCVRFGPGTRFSCTVPEDCASGTTCEPDGYCSPLPVPDGGGAADGGEDGGGGLGPGGPCASAWCWENPAPFGRVFLYGLWTLGPSDTWVCGQAGNLFHWDGARWQQYPLPGRTADLRSVWSPAAGQVTVVGSASGVWYLDGGVMVPATVTGGVTGTLNGVFGLGTQPGEAWAVGNGERTYVQGASDWAQFGTATSVDYEDVAAYSKTDVLMVGDVTRTWNGSAFTLVPNVNGGGTLYSAWPTGDGLYALGGASSAVFLGHPDAGFARLNLGSLGTVRGVWAPGPGDVYAAGTSGAVVRGDGGATQTLFTSATQVINLHGTGHGNVWWVTADGGVFLRAGVDGPNQDAKAETSGLGNAWARAVALEPSGQAWAVGDLHQAWARSAAGAWSPVPTDVVQSNTRFNAVWSDGQGAVYAVGADPATVARYEPAQQQFVKETVSTSAELLGVWGSGPDDVYAAGRSGTVLHRDAAGWVGLQGLPSNVDFGAVFGTSAADVYVGGRNRVILRWDGTAWAKEHEDGTELLRGFCAPAGGQVVYAVGEAGVFLRREGPANWVQESAGTYPLQQFNAVGCAVGRVFAVAESGLVVTRQVTGQWTPVVSGATAPLSGIFGRDPLGFLAVGARGQVLRWVP